MGKAELLTLADRGEKEPPSRELDGDVAEAVGVAPVGAGWYRDKGDAGWWRDWQVDNRPLWRASSYTSSLDDAVSLVPDDCHWLVSWPVGQAQLTRGDGRLFDADAPAAAQALTAAALRARAADMERATAPRTVTED